jgi:hypothetical protein
VTINLHIERLVLEGLPMGASDKLIFLASFEVELARLLRNGGVPGHLRAAAALARTHVGTAPLGKDDGPKQCGVEIAGAVHRAVRRMESSGARESPT